MRGAAMVLATVLAACHPTHYDLESPVEVSGDRATIVSVGFDRLVVLRHGARRTIAYGKGCVTTRPFHLYVSYDGARLWAVDFISTGNFFESSFDVRYTCELDLDAGTEQAVGAGGPSGPADDWFPQLPDAVFDTVPDLAEGCDVVETDSEIVVACPHDESRPEGGERWWLAITRLDRATGAVTARLAPDVTRVDQLRLSRDGARVLYWDRPLEGASTGGLRDATTGEPLSGLAGAGRIVDADFAPAGDALVLAEDDSAIGGRDHGLVRTLALGDHRLEELRRWSFAAQPASVAWLADGRILYGTFSGARFLVP